jgi:hypothetical protein
MRVSTIFRYPLFLSFNTATSEAFNKATKEMTSTTKKSDESTNVLGVHV